MWNKPLEIGLCNKALLYKYIQTYLSGYHQKIYLVHPCLRDQSLF
ncbi:hypothetical protein J645_3235 [Acinetobacter baumannii 1287985]|nr:hypothetical protein J645_3235 [Acinetobacter baumannii 1287985]